MSTLLLYGAIAVVVMILLSKFQIFHIFLFSMMSKIIEALGKAGFGWVLFLVKSIWRAHSDFFRHLTSKEEDFDLELKMEKRTRQ